MKKTLRSGRVYCRTHYAGRLEERLDGFVFEYDAAYLAEKKLSAVSLTLPKRRKPYHSPVLFSFFAGLLTEGGNARMQCRQLRLDENDLFGRLLRCAGEDTIGAVTVRPDKEEE